MPVQEQSDDAAEEQIDGDARHEAPDQPGHGRDRLAHAHHADDDPGLAPDLGHDPAGFDRDEPEWTRGGGDRQKAALGVERSLAQPEPERPKGDAEHREAAADHDLKGHVRDDAREAARLRRYRRAQ